MNISLLTPSAAYSAGGVYFGNRIKAQPCVQNTLSPNLTLDARRVKASELSSLFNISFGCDYDCDKKLNDFCINLEAEIKDMLTPKDASIAENALTPEYIDLINEVFKKDKIGGIYEAGISAGSMLKYLAKKQQLQLKGRREAFVIDRLSLDYIKNNKLINELQCLYEADKLNFYCLDTNKEQTKKLTEEFNSLIGSNIYITPITKPKNSKIANYPDAKIIKSIIKTFAEEKFPVNYIKHERFIDTLCRYIDNNMLAFSYASLTEKLKEHYKNIEKFVQQQGKTMADAVYVIPVKNKSYDMTNYLYAQANNIPSEQFADITEIKNGFDGKKIYIVIDDLCAGGGSASADIDLAKDYIDNIVIAPIIGCKTGERMVHSKFCYTENLKGTFLPLIRYNDLGFIYNIRDIPKYKSALQNYIKHFNDFALEDADFLIDHLKGGCGRTHAFICFPYMIPDNSSEINAFLGGYFLNNDNPDANKAVKVCGGESDRINQTAYETMKLRMEYAAAKDETLLCGEKV